MTFKIYTLGCKVNAYESESLKERLLKEGFQEAKGKAADVYFVNTCAVTNEAERKDLQRVRSLSRSNPGKKIFVRGCSSQIHKEEYLSIPGVAIVTGSSNKSTIELLNPSEGCDYVDPESRKFEYEDTPTEKGEKSVRGYRKVQDGCDNFCSYCVVPYTRGRSRSRNKDSILKEAKSLIENGVRELIIGGIDTGSYHDPENPSYRLKDLLKDRLDITSLPYRIRVSSIEISQIDDAYVELFASHQDKLCPHFHIPLQSGCEKILVKRNRKYKLEDYLNKVNRIREKIPSVAFSTDVISGFPGETDEDFKETYEFCKKVGFRRIHAFPYSERPFTRAAKLPGSVKPSIRQERTRELIKLSDEQENSYRKVITSELVLIEGKNKEGKYEGYSQHYLKYEFESDKDLTGTFVKI